VSATNVYRDWFDRPSATNVYRDWFDRPSATNVYRDWFDRPSALFVSSTKTFRDVCNTNAIRLVIISKFENQGMY